MEGIFEEEMCMSYRWDQEGLPHKGWEEIDVIDLGEDVEPGEEIDYETCEMCGNERIRYVHIMIHPEVDGELRVGCNCAAKMTDDYLNPAEEERELRNRANRRRNFLKQEWYQKRNGNYVLKYKGQYVTAKKAATTRGWGVVYDGKWLWHYKGKMIPDLETAKKAAFELFNRLYEP